MSETTIGTTPAVDEKARFRAFTAAGAALAAIMGGGVISNVLQWLIIDQLQATSGDVTYAMSIGAGP